MSNPVMEFQWVKSRPYGSFLLTAAGKTVGHLQRLSVWNNNKCAEFGGRQWLIKHSCMGTSAEIQEAGFGMLVGTFKSRWNYGGTLTLNDGSTFQLQNSGFWKPVWVLSDMAGQEILRIKERSMWVAGEYPSCWGLLAMFVRSQISRAESDGAAAAVIFVSAGS